MLGQKKRNPDLPAKGNDTTAALIPPTIPPLRTFVIYGPSYGSRPLPGEVLAKDDIRGFTVEAHGLGIDEARMISFVVFFFVDGDPTKPAQAQKLVLNSDAWDEVEEINAAFPTLEKH